MNLYRLDLVSLSLFNLVARTGSISRGAALARLAVGAASKRISDLEAAVGAALLERHSRGVTLTVAGQALLRHARRILGDVDQLEAELSDHASGVAGVVRLWANTSAVNQFLPAALASFVAANPAIRIELAEADSPDSVAAVRDGRADIGIVADRTPADGLELVGYRSDRLVLVVPPGHPLACRRATTLAQAVDYEFVSLSSGTSLSERLRTETEALGRRLKIRIHVRSFDGICRMVAAGLGIAMLPRDAVAPHVASMKLKLVALDEDWAERRLLLVLRDAQALPRHVRRMVDHLVAGTGA